MGNIDGYDGPLLTVQVLPANGATFLSRSEVDILFSRAAADTLKLDLFQDLRRQGIKPNNTFTVEFLATEDSEHIHALNGKV